MSRKKYNNHPLSKGTLIGFGKYIIYEKISSGGYGSVYLAKDDKNTFYAIKEFLPSIINCRPNEDQVKLHFEDNKQEKLFKDMLHTFYMEAESISYLNHPNVIKIVDLFEENNTAYIAMPLEKGTSLFKYINQYYWQHNRFLDEKELKNIFIQICDGIGFLHANNFLHLDMKPGNVWIRPNGEVLILDLGSTRDIESYKNSYSPAFTQGYAAPEQYKNIKLANLDQRTDIYSICGVLKFCLEIEPPIPSLNRKDSDLFYCIERAGQHHPKFLEIVDKGMDLNPKNRYQSIQELKEAFLDIKYFTQSSNYKDLNKFYSKRN